MNEPLERRLHALRTDLVEKRSRLLGIASRLGFSYVAHAILAEHYTAAESAQPKTLRVLIEEFDGSIAELDEILVKRPRFIEVAGLRGVHRLDGGVNCFKDCDAPLGSFPLYRLGR